LPSLEAFFSSFRSWSTFISRCVGSFTLLRYVLASIFRSLT
jgi:hypothetical protein